MANLLAEIEKATVAVAAIGGAIGVLVSNFLSPIAFAANTPTIPPFIVGAVAGGVITFIAFEVLKRVK